ncbi:sirohydrochlorin [Seminavis robusta]|uniref:Sirohydrochlorin n=1 Tax=Seminavis robusta TaxID=568900 RepID=A0A9N8DH11_9STRA|nr:sirohydrochlorin [Seminavis robusta]|eukprot:Sro85_g045130.1 sirohydrochlorin (347) ;mRNA; f:8319-9359
MLQNLNHRSYLVALAVALLVVPCQSFVAVRTRDLSVTKSIRNSPPVYGSTSSNDDEDEPDLLDYFDPLRSPHDYPDGIAPDHKPIDRPKEDSLEGAPNLPAGLDLFASEFPSALMGAPPLDIMDPEESTSSPDPSANRPKFASNRDRLVDQGDDDDDDEEEEEVDLLDVFDPTLSPHAYPNGIPSTKRKKKTTKVGILLMDHGSRNEASNERLHDLARLYQQSFDSSQQSTTTAVIVKAAHMEIATPSIPQVLEAMVKEEQVDEIVCHPYFLSPGRHATQDIPQIIQEAMDDLEISVPVVTTSPVGSSTDLMIRAIHSLVAESSTILEDDDSVAPRRSGERRMGFF